MRKIQIVTGILGVLLGIYTIITAVLYLNRIIDNLGLCMMGLLFCSMFNCLNCTISLIILKKSKNSGGSQ